MVSNARYIADAVPIPVICDADTFPLSDETTVVGYFSWDDVTRMDVMEWPVERFRDVCFGQLAPFVR